MQTRNIDELVSQVHILYNEDKLPLNQKTEEQIDRMIKDHFLYMRKFMQNPYSLEFNMEKVARFKIRYRQIRSKINALVRELKVIRDIDKLDNLSKSSLLLKLYNRFLPDEERLDIKQLQDKLKAELKYWWILKLKFMNQYTKTGKYARLQKLRKMWQERNEEQGKVDIRMKEDYKPYVKTQMPIDQTSWLIDPS